VSIGVPKLFDIACLPFFSSWSFGLNGIPWIVSAEIFPGALRNLTGTFAALCQWLAAASEFSHLKCANSYTRAIQFVITKALPYIFASFGFGTWFFFACWMLLATIWSFFFLPETKGLTLDQMDVLLYVGQPPQSASVT
jgi:hypothetical protein